MQKIFIVASIKRQVSGIILGGLPVEVPLEWSDGMIGACPAFETEESAKAYAGSDCEILQGWVANEQSP